MIKTLKHKENCSNMKQSFFSPQKLYLVVKMVKKVFKNLPSYDELRMSFCRFLNKD